MHSAGVELAKLTYTRLEDNLIRHRGDRLKSPVIQKTKCLVAKKRYTSIVACIVELFKRGASGKTYAPLTPYHAS